MKTYKKYFSRLMGLLPVLLMILSIASCVTEVESIHGFKKPTPESLDRAMALYIQMAYKHLDDKQYDRAMANVKQALDINKNAPSALTALAVVYQKQGDTEKARQTFILALDKDDKFSEGHLNYGQFLYQQKEYEASCNQFQAAADDDFYPRRATAYFFLAACYRARGDIVKTEAALNRSVGLDPNNAQAMGMLASINFDRKQYPEAKQLFDKHVEALHAAKQTLSPEALWLGIQLERVFKNPDAESSYALFLKNNYPYSKEYLEYQNSLKNNR